MEAVHAGEVVLKSAAIEKTRLAASFGGLQLTRVKKKPSLFEALRGKLVRAKSGGSAGAAFVVDRGSSMWLLLRDLDLHLESEECVQLFVSKNSASMQSVGGPHRLPGDGVWCPAAKGLGWRGGGGRAGGSRAARGSGQASTAPVVL